MSQEPETIGRFRVKSLLGRGGMGEVYEALDPIMQRIVAIKIVRPDRDNRVSLDRLYREALAYGRLQHPHIVTVYEANEADDVVFIVMEYLEGLTISSALNQGTLSFELKLKILIQILEALQYAHGQGVVHRDIKPSNVHLLPDGTVKVLDFGLARLTYGETLTQSGLIVGTPYYASPEQLRGEKTIDARTDVYSTGVVAYELLARRHAFNGDSVASIVAKVLSTPAPPLDTAFSQTFPEIESIIRRAMAKSADERYPTAADMKNALVAFLAASREAIVATQVDLMLRTQRALREAETLIDKGRLSESRALLAETLRANPDAREVRALLEKTPPIGGMPEDSSVTVSAPAPVPVLVQRMPVMPVPPPTPVASPPPLTQPADRVVAAPTDPPRPAFWRSGLGAAGAVIAVGIAAMVMAYAFRPFLVGGAVTPGGGPLSAAGGSVTHEVHAAPPPVAGTAVAKSAATPSSTEPLGGPSSRVPGRAATNVSREHARSSTTAAPSIGKAPRIADDRGIYVDARGTDDALRVELVNALKARGATVSATASDARLATSARIDITIRPAPMRGSSAMTADYVATLQISNRITRAREPRSFEGHALEFGEAVVRQAARRRAAEQMADAIVEAIR